MFDLEDAIFVATQAHVGQKDWAGWPYITHPLRIMSKMETEDAKILAVLHDTLEDTDLKEEDLIRLGIAPHILEALKLLTRKDEHDSSDYEEYIDNLSKNPLARKVKIADLEDNMSLTRMPREVNERDIPRLALYFRSWVKLKKLEDPSFTVKVGEGHE